MKKTPLAHIHEQYGAKMMDFGGFYMPVEYSGIMDEHRTVRENVGMFDVSHMGEIWVKGAKAEEFLQRITSNDVSKLFPGKIQYACFPNGKNGIVDDLLVYKYDNQKYLLVVNASNTDKDWNWINANNNNEVELENSSDKIAELAVQGPKAEATIQKLTSINLSEIKSFCFIEGEIGGIKNVIISRTGYTGEDGFELYFYNDYAVSMWEQLMDAGKEFGIKPIGLGARDTLRLESGLTLYGNDIDDTTSIISAGLGWITKEDVKPHLIDRTTIENERKNSTAQRLVGFKMIDKGIPRHDYEIADINGNTIGRVTSGTISPTLNIGVGMGYVNSPFNKIDSEIYIKVRNKLLKAQVVKMPVHKNKN